MDRFDAAARMETMAANLEETNDREALHLAACLQFLAAATVKGQVSQMASKMSELPGLNTDLETPRLLHELGQKILS